MTTYADRVSPLQSFGSNLFEGNDYSVSLSGLLDRFHARNDHKVSGPSDIPLEEMTTPPSQLAFFEMLIRLTGAKRVLEIGTFVGKSTLQFADMVGEKGHVTSIEAVPRFYEIAKENVKAAGYEKRITLFQGGAAEVLDGLENSIFDLIFVDGGKQDYLTFILKSLPLLSNNGMIVVDDIFFHGDALNKNPQTDKGKGCKAVLDYFSEFTGCTKTIIPAWNGVLVLSNFWRL